MVTSNSFGKFITFEGVEGAGKTTNIEFIADKITTAGYEIVLTREPGGTKLGESIRELLISKDYPEMHHHTELLLMFAARAEHLNKIIKPALKKGQWVLCDRFTDATYAYQGAGRNIDSQDIATLETLVQGDIRPDHTFLFDLEAEIGLKRATERGEKDRFEQQHIDFFNKVRNSYLEMAKNDNERYIIINAQYDLETVQKQITKEINKLFI